MSASCESCKNYLYDEDAEYWFCDAELDEDDMCDFLNGVHADCPFYRSDDDYEVVRHQM